MVQKRDKEETDLKVPETLTLCTLSITFNDRRSSPERSDPKIDVVAGLTVDFLPDLPQKQKAETFDDGARESRADKIDLPLKWKTEELEVADNGGA
ncbi:AN1-type zinc finger protein 6 [Orobanche minor]